jgi:hypothetical protein
MGLIDKLRGRVVHPEAERFAEERMQRARAGMVHRPADVGAFVREQQMLRLRDVAAEATRRRRRILMVLALGAVVLLAGGSVAAWIWWYRQARIVQDEQVNLAVGLEEQLQAVVPHTVEVRLQNDSRVRWDGTTVRLRIPESFLVEGTEPAVRIEGPELTWKVGRLKPREKRKLSLRVRIIGVVGDKISLTGEVTFTPENFPGSEFSAKRFFAGTITKVPLEVTVAGGAPLDVTAGEIFTLTIAYQNRSNERLEHARIVLKTPQSFTLQEAKPAAVAGRLIWDLPPLEPLQDGRVEVKGYLRGKTGSTHKFEAQAGFYLHNRFLLTRRAPLQIAISRPELVITQTFNGAAGTLVASPGERIVAEISYKNIGTVGLRDVIAEVLIDGIGMDHSSVETKGGHYDSNAKKIIWQAASRPELKVIAPQQEGKLSFRFRLLRPLALPRENVDDVNFKLTFRTKLDSKDLPAPVGAPRYIMSEPFTILLNSALGLQGKALVDEGHTSLPPSEGPLPPRVGETTTYTLRYEVRNTSNTLTDGLMEVVLPEGVKWLNKYYVTVGTVQFQSRTGKVQWKIPAVAVHAGHLTPAPTLAFQVAITPSANQIGQEVLLAREAQIIATDTFTGAKLSATAEALNTGDADEERGKVEP